MCALTAYVTVAGSSSSHVWLEACARVLIVAAPLAVGMYALRPAAVRALRRAAHPRGRRRLRRDAVGVRERGALQRRAGRGLDRASSVLVYLVLSFPTGRLVTRARPGARRLDRGASSLSSTCRRRCSSSSSRCRPVDDLRRGVPGQRVHGRRRRAGVRRRRRAAAARAARSSRSSPPRPCALALRMRGAHAPDAADARARSRSPPRFRLARLRRGARRAARRAGLGRGRGRALAARAHACR